MITINAPFKLIEPPPRFRGLGFRPIPLGAPTARELTLLGLRVSLRFGGRTCELSSVGDPAADGFRSRGFGWSRQVVPLNPGAELEQQVLVANGGNSVAFSWRLTGKHLVPVTLSAFPLFSGKEPTSTELFKFDPESNGGRLTWQPYHLARRIIADTNGRCSMPDACNAGNLQLDSENVSAPAAFTFELGSRPAVLIFSVEPEENSAVDPFLGGFLAELARPNVPPEGEYIRSLAAA